MVPVFAPAFPTVSFAEEVKPLSPDEQNKEAFKEFEKILDMTENAERSSILPRIEAAYYDIIRRYPEASLAQESYWRIMLIYMRDYNPPAFEKAEALREEFVKKHPDSRLRDTIDNTLGEGYYSHAQWDKLLRFYNPSIKRSIETGKFTRANDIFMYSEAKFNLNDLEEAAKGYRIIIATFPDTRVSALAQKRLEEIQAGKPKQP
jgi:tetratricopeptide (TPR) repeat protein